MYIPDFWSIVKINSDDPHYRVFGTWSGSYLQGASWRMNSGITKVEESDDYYDFYGSSGSVYRCHKKMYGCHHGSLGVLNQVKDESYPGEVLDENTNWHEIDWIIS